MAGAAPIRAARAQNAGAIKIGVLNDQTGPYADLAGPGSVVAAKLAVADVGNAVLGRPLEVIVGDHQNKPDIGAALVREWFGTGDVRMVADFANSAVSLAAQPLARQYDRIVMHVSSTSSTLAGSGCSPNGFQWAQNTQSDAAALFRPLLTSGKTSYFFVTVDYVFGISVEQDAKAVIEAGGGRVLGAVRHPLGNADFASYLETARASGAQVVAFADSGNDMSTAVKQANEFGLAPRQALAAPIAYLTDIHALGLQAAQGLQFAQSWYWDLDDRTRAWAQRFHAQTSRMPTDLQAGVYSATLHYLKAVQKAGTTDTQAVIAAMKALPVEDMYTQNGRILANNKMAFDQYLMRVKAPAQSRGAWDLLEVVAKVPAGEAFRAADQSGCAMAKG
ncbi:MAG: ABC transporter substrate-binding protein [Acidisphaera sp.]|nr:ABC transporter substrate-binding protein [Acidisphaera sp.]